MIKIEYESAEMLMYSITVEEKEALDTIIKITADGGHIHFVQRA